MLLLHKLSICQFEMPQGSTIEQSGYFTPQLKRNRVSLDTQKIPGKSRDSLYLINCSPVRQWLMLHLFCVVQEFSQTNICKWMFEQTQNRI